MAKSKKTKKKVDKAAHKASTTPIHTLTAPLPFLRRKEGHRLLIFLLAFGLYANTLTHNYAVDDAIVIYDNMFTQDGLSGIPGILQYDTFFGFFKEEGKANLVTGGRYRPFTLMMFAVEWQLFGRSPFIGHLMNVLLYGLLGIVLYNLLSLLIIGQNRSGKREDRLRSLVLVACLLFVAHPIHTEAVANIKGRDEIMTMMGALLAFWASLKYYYSKKIKYAIYAMLAFFMGLMSKENAITFLAVVPLGYMLFKRQSLINSLKHLWPFMVSTILFLVIRTLILGADFGTQSMELMNNPYLKLAGNNWVPFSGAEKLATILVSLGKYLVLMVFPHPLCHDYYPRSIDIMQLSDWSVLLSLAVHIAMLGLAVWSWKRDKVVSFGLFFYFITLSIVSNVVFPIGTLMSERFLFIPSLGLLLALASLMTRLDKKVLYIVTGLLILLFGLKTITRNLDWKDDFTLFTTDVETNPRSAKLLNAAGGTLTTTAGRLPTTDKERKVMLDKAKGYLTQAIDIHPTYRNAYLLLGNAHYYLDEYPESISRLEQVLALYPDYADAKKNLPVILRDGGKYYGEKVHDIEKSEALLLRSLELAPNDDTTIRLLGIVNGIKQNYPKALEYFEQYRQKNPDSASSYVNLGTTYQNMGDKDKARYYYDKATEIDPKALNQLAPQ